MKKQAILIIICFVFASVLINAQTKHIVQATSNGFQFIPMNVNAVVGDTIEWQWLDGAHTTTSDDQNGADHWDSPLSSSHPVFQYVITTAGVHGYHCIPHQSFGMVGTITVTEPTGVNDKKLNPVNFKLFQNYPNPFNPSTIISYSIPNSSKVSLIVYNSIGAKVAELVNEVQSAGYHSAEFNSADFRGISSGVYYYRITAGSLTKTQKMLLLK